MGTWTVAEDGGEKVLALDERPWVASKDNPTRLLVESARKLYGTNNEGLMDNAKQFAYYPVAILKSVENLYRTASQSPFGFTPCVCSSPTQEPAVLSVALCRAG